ncbi:M23 family metallopeptidase [Roseivirga sp. UBA838]|uniref:M23 family metallopeptidase n=2 Tax=unclassified Roseivirga TaxID=2626142 RepID=UPI002580DA92|nr:M23 family metallopeptidase [Roseivirga sp. UBA838]
MPVVRKFVSSSMRWTFLLLLSVHWTFAQSVDMELRIFAEDSENEVSILADNQELFPISVSLQLRVVNAKLPEDMEEFYVIPPKTRALKLTSITKPQNQTWSYQLSYNYAIGNAKAVHNDDHTYRLPFLKGKSYRLSQGYNGATTHRGSNALDFTMPEGDTITAARPGVVVRIKEDSRRGCPSSECADYSNYVTLLHDDGTLADYVHLKYRGVLVALGDTVLEGQPIALAGATGWASGSHLHFVVYTTGKSPYITIPVRFEVAEGKVQSLQEGELYTAFKHPF